MDRNRNQEHISIRADASEFLEVDVFVTDDSLFAEFQFALMRVNSLRAPSEDIGEVPTYTFQFALMRVNSLRRQCNVLC